MPFVLPVDGNHNPVPALRPISTERLTLSGSSVATAAATTEATIIRVISNADTFIAVGANPTATQSSMYLPANTPEYIALASGDKLAALSSSSTGFMYVTTCR